MSIYAILASKPHNPHYLNRYIRFIDGCQKVNEDFTGYTEKHHICPQAKDLFPEYKSFKEHPRNCAILTARQHFIAHRILWKAYPDNKSMRYAFWRLVHGKHDLKMTSSLYESIRLDHIDSMYDWNHSRLKNGTHHCKNGISCVNKQGEVKFIPREEYYDQSEINQENKQWVSSSSTEGKKRRGFNKPHHTKGLVTIVDKEGNTLSIQKDIYKELKESSDDTYAQVSSKEGQRRLGKEFSRKVVCIDKLGNKMMITSEQYKKQQTTTDCKDWEFVMARSFEAKRRKASKL